MSPRNETQEAQNCSALKADIGLTCCTYKSTTQQESSSSCQPTLLCGLWYYTCVHTFMHTCIHIHKHIFVHVYVHMHMRIPYTDVYVYMHMHMYMHMYIHMYIHMYMHMSLCVYYVCMHGWMDGWMYACVHVTYIHSLHIYAYVINTFRLFWSVDKSRMPGGDRPCQFPWPCFGHQGLEQVKLRSLGFRVRGFKVQGLGVQVGFRV